mgnify:CR=1 FL=1
MTFDPTTHPRLVELIKQLAVVHGRVTLSSGIEADYYVDLRRATLHHEAAPLIGQAMIDLLDLNGITDYEAVGDPRAIRARDGLLALRRDIRQNISHFLFRAHGSLARRSAHAHALPGAPAGLLFVLRTLQRNVVLVGVAPGIDGFLLLQTRRDEQRLGAGVDRVDALRQRFVGPALLRRQADQVRAGIRGRDPRATVWHLVVDLGDLDVALFGVPVVEIGLQLRHRDAARTRGLFGPALARDGERRAMSCPLWNVLSTVAPPGRCSRSVCGPASRGTMRVSDLPRFRWGMPSWTH